MTEVVLILKRLYFIETDVNLLQQTNRSLFKLKIDVVNIGKAGRSMAKYKDIVLKQLYFIETDINLLQQTNSQHRQSWWKYVQIKRYSNK